MCGSKPFKSGAETRRRIRGHSQLKPATPAANLMPNVLLCIPLDHTRKAERGVLMSGQPSSSIQLPRLAPWRGYSSAAASATDQHGRQQLRVISPEHIGVSLDGGRGHHAPLVSYRPPQAGQPPANKVHQSACFNGCLRLRTKSEEQTENPA